MTYAGARWWRADLHVHTPFDGRGFGENLRSVLESADAGDKRPITQLAERFWNACDRVDIVGITDHNSIEGYRQLKPHLASLSEAARARHAHAPIFLPGVEITVGSERAMHFLVLFSSNCALDSIARLVGVVFGALPTHDEEGRPQPSGTSVGDFLRDLREVCTPDSGQRRIPFVVIPAHVESSRGLAKETGLHDRTGPEMAQEMRGILRERAITRASWHGFQTTNRYEHLPDHLRELLCAWEANRRELRWEELDDEHKREIRELRRWPLVEASDPSTYDEIGSHFSWLKMAKPDLEGIRVALLDPESRLRRMEEGEPGRDYPHIRRLAINETDFADAYELELSPNLNTLIGGRGSGKSSLVELLRYGLERDRAEDFHEAESETRDTLMRLLVVKDSRDSGATPGILLPETRVQIDFSVAGMDYRAERSSTGIAVYRSDGGDYLRDDALDLRTLIKPQIISQGQIARIARDSTAQRREIDRIASGDPRIADFWRQRVELESRLEQFQGQLRAAVRDDTRLRAVQTELRTVRDQLGLLERGEIRETLQTYRTTRRDDRHLARWSQLAEDVATSLDVVAIAATRAAESVRAEPDAVASIAAHAERQRGLLEQAAATASADARSLREAQSRIIEATNTAFEPIRSQAVDGYEQLVSDLRQQGISLDEHQALTARRSSLEEEVAALEQGGGRQDALREQIESTAAALESLYGERLAGRRAVGQLLEDGNADIRLTVAGFADRTDLAAKREAWFGGANLHGADWDVLVDWVFSTIEDIPTRWRSLVSALMSDVRAAAGIDVSELAATSALLGDDVRFSGHFARAVPRMDLTRLESAYRFLPDDRVDASVKDTDGEFKPMDQGSLGQRSTAILSLLLSAGDDPLVVDQPEEDLDNQYVYSVVVDLLRKRKFARQLILATHNANIPVNGDAELIVSLAVKDRLGVVGAIGSIDQDEIKTDVNAVLEGSAEAFRLRRRRYGYYRLSPSARSAPSNTAVD